MSDKSAIFVCVHNSARSQMGEAFLKKFGSDLFSRIESGGIEAGTLNPLVVQAMSEIGIDISGNRAKPAMEFVRNGTHFDYVITVCDAASAERCPIFSGNQRPAEVELRRSVGADRHRRRETPHDPNHSRRDRGNRPELGGVDPAQRVSPLKRSSR